MSHSVTTLKAIIFDVDGTLADTEEVHRLAFNATFRECGLDWFWTPTLYEQLLSVSGGRERITSYAAEHPHKATGGELTPQRVAEIHRIKTDRYAALLAAGRIPLRDGTVRLLHEARAVGVRLAIATSSARSNLDTLLDLNLTGDWRSWFEAIATCETTPDKKPSPAVYLEALHTLGLPAAGCVAIEDTQNGLRAASAAALSTVITTHRYTRRHAFAGAALVVDSLGEPDQPPKLLHGNLHGEACVTLTLLAQLLRAPRLAT